MVGRTQNDQPLVCLPCFLFVCVFVCMHIICSEPETSGQGEGNTDGTIDSDIWKYLIIFNVPRRRGITILTRNNLTF